AAAEAGAIAHMNADHADACADIARAHCGAGAGKWRLTAIDLDGCDLSDGNRAARFWFPEPILDAGGLHRALVQAARSARGLI
ncbi:MAG TPA: DUF2470 domain-containing protein, partial [Roseomonas sp.]